MGAHRPVPACNGSTGKIFCHPGLPKVTHTFVRRETQRSSLYSTFPFLCSSVRQDTMFIERLKPAFLDVSDVPYVADTNLPSVIDSQKEALILYVPRTR